MVVDHCLDLDDNGSHLWLRTCAALASGPIATVLQDILSVAIYLGIAASML
jgi:hypothetical protein